MKINKAVLKIMYIISCAVAIFGWWGAIYPQFTLLEGTYDVVYESDVPGVGDTGDTDDAGTLYWQILSADSSGIRMKSKLLESWNALREGRK